MDNKPRANMVAGGNLPPIPPAELRRMDALARLAGVSMADCIKVLRAANVILTQTAYRGSLNTFCKEEVFFSTPSDDNRKACTDYVDELRVYYRNEDRQLVG